MTPRHDRPIPIGLLGRDHQAGDLMGSTVDVGGVVSHLPRLRPCELGADFLAMDERSGLCHARKVARVRGGHKGIDRNAPCPRVHEPDLRVDDQQRHKIVVHTGSVADDTRRILLAKQREVTSLIQDLTDVLDSAGDSANRSRGDRYGLSTDRHSQAATLNELRRQSTVVARALAKIDEGTYGACDACGSGIPQERMEFHPWAVLCVPCSAGT